MDQNILNIKSEIEKINQRIKEFLWEDADFRKNN